MARPFPAATDSLLLNLVSTGILIGVTGHRDLLHEDYEFEINSPKSLNQSLKRIFNDIQAKHPGKQLFVVSCLAEGADLLAIFVAAELGLTVIPILMKEDLQLAPFEETWEECKAILFGAGDVISKTNAAAKRTDLYEMTAEIVAGYSNYLIALWDGVETGLPWGTSDIVRTLLDGKNILGTPHRYRQKASKILTQKERRQLRKNGINARGKIFQILTRRRVNQYPVSRFENIDKQYADLPIGKKQASTYFPLLPEYKSPWKRYWKRIKKSILFNRLIWQFILPILLVVFTISLGIHGFSKQRGMQAWQDDKTASGMLAKVDSLLKHNPHINTKKAEDSIIHTYNWDYPVVGSSNDFYNAINLITLNSSVIQVDKLHWTLVLARVMGLLCVILGFSIALVAALGVNFKTEITLFGFTFLKGIGLKRGYTLVIGASEMGVNLAYDIRKKGKLVILLDSTMDESLKLDALFNGLNVFRGTQFSSSVLKKLKVHIADEVFIMSDNDSNNIRSFQELDQLCYSRPMRHRARWLIHLQDQQSKELIRNSDKLTTNAEVEIVNTYENIARRTLLRYPVDSFNPKEKNKIAEVAVFGNSEVAKQIVINIIKQGQYNNGNRLRITWFVQDKDKSKQDFLRRFPCLRYIDGKAKGGKKLWREINEFVFPENLLQFKELPLSDLDYFKHASMRKAILEKNIIRIYVCMENNIQSAGILNIISKKVNPSSSVVNRDHDIDLKMFCFYNIPDKEEARHAELISNRKVPYTPVIFFGNFLDECTWQALTEKSMDQLPMLINFWHSGGRSMIEDGKQDKVSIMRHALELWRNTRENYKESSRQAADHLWVKIRMLENPLDTIIHGKFRLSNKLFQDIIWKLAEVEHYRWCRERLMEGFLPLQDFEASASTNQGWFVKNWNNPDFKNFFQDRKLHLDIVLFEKLFSGIYDGRDYDEKEKDISFIEAIPFFLRLLSR